MYCITLITMFLYREININNCLFDNSYESDDEK